jgi:hypothetical protein
VDDRRARRHPLAILGVYAWQAALGLLVAAPVASLARAAYGNDPRGDGPLWTPGGHALLDFLTHERHAIAVAGSGAQVALVVGLVGGLLPTGAALVAMTYRGQDAPRAGLPSSLAAAVRLFPAMLVLLVAGAVVLALLALLGMGVADVVESWGHGAFGEALSEQVAAVALVPVLLAASVVLVVGDLSRAAIVRFEARAWRGIACGVAEFARAPVSLWWSWAWRGLVSIVLAVAGAALALGTWPVWLLVLLHQTIVLARVTVRVSWWSRTLRQPIEPVTPG